jgi:DNA-directed RNA polymerase subunit K/omega
MAEKPMENDQTVIEEDQEEPLDMDDDVELDTDDEITVNDDLGDLTDESDDDESIEGSKETQSEFVNDNITFYDSDEDEEDEEDFDKLNTTDISIDLLNEHPEYKYHNIKEVNALCNVIRDASGNIIDELHNTIPFITRYEKAKIIGERSKQLSYSNVEPMITVPSHIIDNYEIALLEYNANAIPFIIKRNLPDGSCEYWKFKDLEKIIFD